MKQRKFAQKNINAVLITCSPVEIASQNLAHTRWIILTDHEVQHQERLSNTLDWTRVVVRSRWQNWALNEAEQSSIRCLCSIELYSCHTIGLSFPYIFVTQKSLFNAIDKLSWSTLKKKGHSETCKRRKGDRKLVLFSRWQIRSLCTRRWDCRRRRNKWKGSIFRTIEQYARQVERINVDVRPSLWRTTDCLHQFHAFPYPPPSVVYHHLHVHPYHLGQSSPFLNAPFPQRPPAQTPQPCSSPFAQRNRDHCFGRSPDSLEMQFRSSFCRGLNGSFHFWCFYWDFFLRPLIVI